MFHQWFAHPDYLWLLLALVPFAVWDWWRRWAAGRGRQMVGVIVRFILLASFVLALAEPSYRETWRVADVIFAVDRSASIPDSLLVHAMQQVEVMRDGLGSEERAGLILFDGRPEVLVYPGDPWEPLEPWRQTPVEETNLATALWAALGLVSEQHAGRIVLVSDGRGTAGDIQGPLEMARLRGIPIYTLSIDPGFVDPAVVSIDVDDTDVRPGQTLSGSAEIRSGPESMSGRVLVRLEDEVVGESAVSMNGSTSQSIPFTASLSDAIEPGLARLTAELVLDEGIPDERTQDNRAALGLNVLDPPSILILARDPAEVVNLSDLLRAERMTVDVVTLPDLSRTPLSLDGRDLLVLANIPAVATEPDEPVLSEDQIQAIRRYVSTGGGLVVLGGDRAYELGGYGQTQLATVLPVELRPRDPELEPAATVMIILDNSGSMDTPAEGGTKMDLANAGTVAAMRLLRTVDRIGVTAVDERVDWVVPIQEVTDPQALERMIRGIRAGGGGIYVYTALREAYRALRTQTTPLRHVILFADAADSEEQVSGVVFGWGAGPNSYDLARSMRMEGITVSVIGIGASTDSDAGFLRQLAEAGGGHYYLTARASELESLFVQETQRLVDSVLHEAPFRVRVQGEHPAIEGIDLRRSPLLHGFIQLEARDTAQVTLTTPEGFAAMSTWQYGLGQVAAMAFDAGPRWSSAWLTWEGYPLFWTQLARWALRRHEGDDMAAEVLFDGDQGMLRLARRSTEGLTEVEGGLEAWVAEVGPGDAVVGVEMPVSLNVLEPGLWDARFPVSAGRRYQIRVADAGGEEVARQTFVAPPALEYRHEGPDRELLGRLAAGSGASMEVAAFASSGPTAEVARRRPLWLWILCVALILMPVDAFLRRPAREM